MPNQSISRTVFDWLIDYIKTNRLKAGDPLPNEREIGRELGVSRTPVREAIAFLKAFGLVQSKRSIGLMFTADPRRLELLSLFVYQEVNGNTFRKIKQLRDFIELGSAHLMIRNAGAEDIAFLRELLRLATVANGDGKLSAVEFEVRFHERLAVLGGNDIAVALSLIYRPLFTYHIAHHPLLRGKLSFPEKAVLSHTKMVDALERRDFESLLAELRNQALQTE